MESEDAGHVSAVELPTSVAQWVTETADELGVSRQRLLSELLAAHGSLHEGDADDGPDELDELREEFMKKLTDVRERVVQIKRETDGKARADDENDGNAEDDENVGEDIAKEVDRLRERVVENRERLDSGFENYEEVLDYLTETTDELDARLDVLARALVSVRDQARALATENATRAVTAELARTANRYGIESAKCGDCEMSVIIALLTEPSCPHCGATFEDIEPKQGFFGSSWLVVGRPPALEGDTIDPDADIDPEAADLLSEVTEE